MLLPIAPDRATLFSAACSVISIARVVTTGPLKVRVRIGPIPQMRTHLARTHPEVASEDFIDRRDQLRPILQQRVRELFTSQESPAPVDHSTAPSADTTAPSVSDPQDVKALKKVPLLPQLSL